MFLLFKNIICDLFRNIHIRVSPWNTYISYLQTINNYLRFSYTITHKIYLRLPKQVACTQIIHQSLAYANVLNIMWHQWLSMTRSVAAGFRERGFPYFKYDLLNTWKYQVEILTQSRRLDRTPPRDTFEKSRYLESTHTAVTTSFKCTMYAKHVMKSHNNKM